jgi:hypothetical protein
MTDHSATSAEERRMKKARRKIASGDLSYEGAPATLPPWSPP